VGPYEHTYCPTCREKLIERTGYVVLAYRLTGEGHCPKCGTHIAGIWPTDPKTVRVGSVSDLWNRRPRAVR
jgi:ribosomal protein L34E